MPNITARFVTRSYCDIDLIGNYQISNGEVGTGDFYDTQYITDRNPNTYAMTSAEDALDTIDAELVINFIFSRDIDTITMHHNFASFDLYYSSDNETWTSFDSVVENTSEFYIHTISRSVSAVYVKLVAHSTIIPDSRKILYHFGVHKYIGDFYLESVPKVTTRTVKADYENIYGRSLQVYSSPAVETHEIEMNWNNMRDIEKEIYNPSTGETFYLNNVTTLNAMRMALKDDSIYIYLYLSDSLPVIGEKALYLCNLISEDIMESAAGDNLECGFKCTLTFKET